MNINNSAVEDPNSEITKQIVEKSDGTKITIENKSNNPTWRGENQSSEANKEQSMFDKSFVDTQNTYMSGGKSFNTEAERDAYKQQMFGSIIGSDTTPVVDNKVLPITAGDDKFTNMPFQATTGQSGDTNVVFGDSITGELWDQFDDIESQNNRLYNTPVGVWDDTASMELDRQKASDPSFFDDGYGFINYDDVVYGNPELVEPLEGVEELTSPQTDAFWREKDNKQRAIDNQAAFDSADTDYFGNPLTNPDGELSLFDGDAYERHASSIMQNSLPKDMQSNVYKHKFKSKEEEERANFMSSYIVNPKTDSEKAQNKKLVWDNMGFKDKTVSITADAFLEAMSYIVPSEEFVDGAIEFVTDPEWREEISDWAKEEPLAAAASLVLMYKGRKALKALPKKYQEAVNKFVSSGKMKARINTAKNRIATGSKKVKDLEKALKGHSKGSKAWTDASMRLTRARQRLQGHKNAHKRLVDMKRLNTGTMVKTVEKIQNSKTAKNVFNTVKKIDPVTALAGGAIAYSIFDDDPAQDVSESSDAVDSKPESDFNKVTESSASKALERARKDREGAAISDAIQRDRNVAQQVIDNQGRIQQEYGDSLAKDLFTIAVSSLAGFSPMGVMGAMGDKLILDQASDRSLKLQGLKDQASLNKESFKQSVKAQKELAKENKADRKATETKMMNIIKEGGKKGSSLSTHSGEVLGALMMADKLKMDYNRNDVQKALVDATQKSIGEGSYFDSEDETEARSNIAGHFMGNMAILSTDGGSLSKDGYALKSSSAADNGAYTHWLFSRHDKNQVRGASTKKFNEWKSIRSNKGESWLWYNNFTGWAVQNLKATGQM